MFFLFTVNSACLMYSAFKFKAGSFGKNAFEKKFKRLHKKTAYFNPISDLQEQGTVLF